MTILPMEIKHENVRLPKYSDFTVSGLRNVSTYAWIIDAVFYRALDKKNISLLILIGDVKKS